MLAPFEGPDVVKGDSLLVWDAPVHDQDGCVDAVRQRQPVEHLLDGDEHAPVVLVQDLR